MNDLELIKMKLSRLDYPAVYRLSKETGIPATTLWHIRKKETKNPRFKTVEKLAAHYKQKAA